MFISEHVTKPVLSYIAGFSAPPGKTMGHAGAIISGTSGTAEAKKAALEARGIEVGTTPTEVAQIVADRMAPASYAFAMSGATPADQLDGREILVPEVLEVDAGALRHLRTRCVAATSSVVHDDPDRRGSPSRPYKPGTMAERPGSVRRPVVAGDEAVITVNRIDAGTRPAARTLRRGAFVAPLASSNDKTGRCCTRRARQDGRARGPGLRAPADDRGRMRPLGRFRRAGRRGRRCSTTRPPPRSARASASSERSRLKVTAPCGFQQRWFLATGHRCPARARSSPAIWSRRAGGLAAGFVVARASSGVAVWRFPTSSATLSPAHRGRRRADRPATWPAPLRVPSPGLRLDRNGSRSPSRAGFRPRNAFRSPSSRTARARRSNATARPSCRTARRRVRAAPRVDRGAARCRAGPRRRHERRAPGLRVPGRAARSTRCAGARRGADVRPAAEDPHAPRRRDRRGCRWTTTGSEIDALERALADGDKPAFLYTIATFQNPSGRTLSEERRRRIAELAREHDLLVLEDDPYGLVRYEGEAPPDDLRAGGGANVAYASSFSKTIAPGVRVGYFVLPDDLAKQIEALAVSTYISPPFMTQATVHEFLQRGNFEPNLERVRGLLRARRDTMLESLESQMPVGCDVESPRGWLFHLARSRRRDSRRPARPRRAGRRHVRARDGLLRGRRRYAGRCGSPSASSRRPRSPTASTGSPATSRCAVAGACALAARAGARRGSRSPR